MKVRFIIYAIGCSWFLFSCVPFQDQEEDINYIHAETLKNRADKLYKEKKYQQSITYYNQAIEAGEQFGFEYLVADSYNDRGRAYDNLKNHVESILNFEKAIDMYLSLKDLDQLPKSLYNLGRMYKKQNLNEQALTAYLEAYTLFDNTRQEKKLAIVCYEIGLINKRLNKFEEAINYYERSIEITKRLGDKKNLAKALHNLGITYTRANEFTNALIYLKEAETLKTELAYKKSLTNTHSMLAETYFHLGNLKKSEEYYLKSYQLRKSINYKKGFIEDANELALLYLKLNKHELVKKYLSIAHQMAKETSYHEELIKNYQYNILLNEKENKPQLISFYNTSITSEQIKLDKIQLGIQKASDQIADKLEAIKLALKLAKETQKQTKEAKTQMTSTFGGITALLLAGLVFYERKTKLTTRLDKPLFGLSKRENLMRIFIKETHHRCKNNMMVLSSVVSCDLYKINSKLDKLWLLETKNWFETIIFVNKKLGNAHEGIITHIDLEEFIENIVQRAISNAYLHQLTYQLDLKKHKVEQSSSLLLGLIINEIIVRLINDVLREIEQPELSITANKIPRRRLSLIFKGNGTSLPEDTKQNIQSILQELKGIIIENDQECSIELQISE